MSRLRGKLTQGPTPHCPSEKASNETSTTFQKGQVHTRDQSNHPLSQILVIQSYTCWESLLLSPLVVPSHHSVWHRATTGMCQAVVLTSLWTP